MIGGLTTLVASAPECTPAGGVIGVTLPELFDEGFLSIPFATSFTVVSLSDDTELLHVELIVF